MAHTRAPQAILRYQEMATTRRTCIASRAGLSDREILERANAMPRHRSPGAFGRG